ncbi:MAG TPA: hypothetical protein VMW45_02330, partial [Dehalococcoidia bacterium]|nr:hypothetical protein [Dehalococcoidia bacterium]
SESGISSFTLEAPSPLIEIAVELSGNVAINSICIILSPNKIILKAEFTPFYTLGRVRIRSNAGVARSVVKPLLRKPSLLYPMICMSLREFCPFMALAVLAFSPDIFPLHTRQDIVPALRPGADIDLIRGKGFIKFFYTP